MKRCPITYDMFAPELGERYSRSGLRRLSPNLKHLADLPFDTAQQQQEAAARATKMSIQGVQPKLSARLDVRQGRFELVDQHGRYILKPPSPLYPHLPENEDLTMHLAATAGIEVPVHGLIKGSDETWTYFIQRFDRAGRRAKLAVEDFAQLSRENRETKYNSSMEKVADVLDRFATFPRVDGRDLFVRTVFFYLTGGEDMHLKNFSLLTDQRRVRLAPAYDFLNSTIALRHPTEEFALPLQGRKRKLTREDLVDYFGRERLQLPVRSLDQALAQLEAVSADWPELIGRSFLPNKLISAYLAVLAERRARIWGPRHHNRLAIVAK